jgi:hypothetical protein
MVAIARLRKLDEQVIRFAISLALLSEGKRIASSKAIIAMTTNSSIRVKPLMVLAVFLLMTYPLTKALITFSNN